MMIALDAVMHDGTVMPLSEHGSPTPLRAKVPDNYQLNPIGLFIHMPGRDFNKPAGITDWAYYKALETLGVDVVATMILHEFKGGKVRWEEIPTSDGGDDERE